MSFRIRTALIGLPFALAACTVFAQSTLTRPAGSSMSGPMGSSSGRSSSSVAAKPAAKSTAPVRNATPAYRSSFEDYRPFVDEAVSATSWREANDRVGRIGGWRAYAAEIQNETATPASASSDPAAGTGSNAPAGRTAGHAGHHTR